MQSSNIFLLIMVIWFWYLVFFFRKVLCRYIHYVFIKLCFLRTSVLWGVTQHMLIVVYRHFGTACRCHLEVRAAWPLQIGLLGCSETSVSTTNTGCVTSQKSEELSYTVGKPDISHCGSCLSVSVMCVRFCWYLILWRVLKHYFLNICQFKVLWSLIFFVCC